MPRIGLDFADASQLLGFLHALNRDRTDEFVHAFFINRRGQLAWSETLASGQGSFAHFEFRTLICTAFRADATGLILAHNHPSGTARPSPRDVTATLDLQRVCAKVGIDLIDHIIVTSKAHFSFRSEFILESRP